MVQVTTSTRGSSPESGYSTNVASQGTPQNQSETNWLGKIHVHFTHRDVFGNGIAIRSYGAVKMAAGEYIWAYECKLNTLQVLLLTPELSPPQLIHINGELEDAVGYTAVKAISTAKTTVEAKWRPGEYQKIKRFFDRIRQLRQHRRVRHRKRFPRRRYTAHRWFNLVELHRFG